ncbi:DUF3502 domain-containing protein [uncultured Chloroflexus sp.]|uniref:DUF3502 domain-containing protein n=1 Tax=uncultured Chloroflexus sp. TaxID=214040 RepID=UPI00345ABCC7
MRHASRCRPNPPQRLPCHSELALHNREGPPETPQRLDEAGLQTIIAEAQKQLNEWAKTK